MLGAILIKFLTRRTFLIVEKRLTENFSPFSLSFFANSCQKNIIHQYRTIGFSVTFGGTY
jgi:hypothetical protein